MVSTDGSTPDRVVVGTHDAQRGYTPWEIERADGSAVRSGVPGDIPQQAHEFVRPGEEADAERAVALAIGARDLGSDALVTMNPLLLDGFPRDVVEGVNPMPPEAAVSLLGLYLRVREDFALELQPGFRERFDRRLFYLVLMRDLTPSGWRWFSACVANYVHSSNDDLMLLAQSGMERLERALRARDRLHEQLQLPPTTDRATEAIFYLDVMLLMLGGAFDATAVVAHRIHGLSAPEHAVGWGNTSWMSELGQVNQPLVDLMTKEQPHRDARELVAVLRNTIHSAALRRETWQAAGRDRSERIVVPERAAKRLERVVGRLASLEVFGLARDPRALYVEPGVYAEAVIPRAADALNAIMDATPVETLAGVNPGELPAGPPDDDGVFSPAIRKRVRMLGGIDRAPASQGSP